LKSIQYAALLILFLASVQGVPQAQTVPQESRDYATILNQDDGPGASCLRLAFVEYNAVLSDAVNRQDHLALAIAYEAMGERHLEC
jgi:hypothetical protein